jgi:hypothetical protein
MPEKVLHLSPSVTKASVRVTAESPVCNSSRNTRIEILGIIVSQVVTIVGVPSYTSGVRLWNGAAAILNRKSTTCYWSSNTIFSCY